MQETGLPHGVVFELVLKRVFMDGTTTLRRLIDDTKLDYGVVHAVFRNLQKEQLCHTKGMIGDDFEFVAEAGNRHAFAKPTYHSHAYFGNMGYSLIRCNRLDLTGRVKGRPSHPSSMVAPNGFAMASMR